MQPTAETPFAQRLRRFARWFFTVSPEDVADPLPVCRARAAGARPARGARQESPRLRAQHAGRFHVRDRKQP